MEDVNYELIKDGVKAYFGYSNYFNPYHPGPYMGLAIDVRAEFKGLKPFYLSDVTNIPVDRLVAFESGEKIPTYKEFAKMVDYLSNKEARATIWHINPVFTITLNELLKLEQRSQVEELAVEKDLVRKPIIEYFSECPPEMIPEDGETETNYEQKADADAEKTIKFLKRLATETLKTHSDKALVKILTKLGLGDGLGKLALEEMKIRAPGLWKTVTTSKITGYSPDRTFATFYLDAKAAHCHSEVAKK